MGGWRARLVQHVVPASVANAVAYAFGAGSSLAASAVGVMPTTLRLFFLVSGLTAAALATQTGRRVDAELRIARLHGGELVYEAQALLEPKVVVEVTDPAQSGGEE